MIDRRPRVSVLLLVSAALAIVAGGCTNRTESFSGTLPPGTGITCHRTELAADGVAARAALAQASPGTCVVLTGATYAGPFDVGPRVALVAQNGSRATITGGTAQAGAISLAEGAQLANVDVVASPGAGVVVRAASAVVTGVTVTGAKSAALAVLCAESATPGCATGSVTLTSVALEKSAFGLWIAGAHVVMKGGSSNNHTGTGLASGAGVIAQAGALLEVDGAIVEKNQSVGLLIDGAATRASLKNVIVNENGERGVWLQRVLGTVDAPAVRLDECQLTKNRIVGLGAVESRGIIIVGGRISDTAASPVLTSLQQTESIGDGVGLYASGEFKLDGALVESNARAAGVVDGNDRGIIIVGGKVGPGAAGLKFVVQNTKGSEVQIPEGDRSTTEKPVGISAPKLVLPPML